MRSVMRWTLTLLALSAICNQPANADLILNGSFEDPPVPAGSYTTYVTGSTGITGWTVVGPDVSVVSGTFTDGGITFEAQDGQQWLDLTGPGTNSKADGLTQDVATTIGQLYRLTFYVGSATDGSSFFPSTVDLSINGGARTSYSNPTAPTNMLDWEPFTVDFTATGATTNLTFYNGSAPNNNVSALDHVSLNPTVVPEPSGLILAANGAAMLIAYGWRLRNSRVIGVTKSS